MIIRYILISCLFTCSAIGETKSKKYYVNAESYATIHFEDGAEKQYPVVNDSTNPNEWAPVLLPDPLLKRGWTCVRSAVKYTESSAHYGYTCHNNKNNSFQFHIGADSIYHNRSYGSICEVFDDGSICVRFSISISETDTSGIEVVKPPLKQSKKKSKT